MKTAKDFPVTQPYGYDKNYQGNAQHWHTGVDYGATEGIPIVVNGVQIGITGHTGKVYDQNGHNTVNAAHVHVGRYAPGETNPGSGGWDIPNPRVTEIGYDSSNGNYVGLLDANGVRWVYLHMQEKSNNVKVGDYLDKLPKYDEEDDVIWNNGDTYNLLFHSVGMDVAERAKAANYEGYFSAQDGEEFSKAFYEIINSLQYGQMVQAAQASKEVKPYDGPPLYVNK